MVFQISKITLINILKRVKISEEKDKSSEIFTLIRKKRKSFQYTCLIYNTIYELFLSCLPKKKGIKSIYYLTEKQMSNLIDRAIKKIEDEFPPYITREY